MEQNHLLGILMLSSVMFNFTDLATALAASAKGLGGADAFLAVAPGAAGLPTIAWLVGLNVLLVAAAVAVALIGGRTGSIGARRLALAYLLISTALFYADSLKNIFWLAV